MNQRHVGRLVHIGTEGIPETVVRRWYFVRHREVVSITGIPVVLKMGDRHPRRFLVPCFPRQFPCFPRQFGSHSPFSTQRRAGRFEVSKPTAHHDLIHSYIRRTSTPRSWFAHGDGSTGPNDTASTNKAGPGPPTTCWQPNMRRFGPLSVRLALILPSMGFVPIIPPLSTWPDDPVGPVIAAPVVLARRHSDASKALQDIDTTLLVTRS